MTVTNIDYFCGDFTPHDSKEHWQVDILVLGQMICMVKIDLITV
jgi:hypothetical protein